MITIVYCHPSDGSFNHQILQSITDRLSGEGREYYVINLYGEGFNPVLDSRGLHSYVDGGSVDDEMVERYQKALRQSEQLVCIFPIWWGMMPAMFKGFIDRVFTKGIVYDTTPEGELLPCLSIDRTTIVTTSEESSDIIAPFFDGYLTPQVFNPVGINGVSWFNCDHTTDGSAAHRQEFIDTVTAHIVR